MTDPAFPDKMAGPVAYSESLAAVRALMTRTLRRTDPVLAPIMTHLAQENGKNFRASLLLAAAADPAGLVAPEAIAAAAALEILHLATLVHDDIIDDAPTRRGQPSVQSRFGKQAAVLGGDYLFCVSFTMIAALAARYPEKLSDFARATTLVCVGELRQQQHIGDTELTPFGYLRTIAGKTAALFALALYSGGILGGDSEKEARLLGRIGLNIGMLFQLADDCLDYETTEATFRKSVRHDLNEGVVTLPLILTFAINPDLKALMRGKVLDRSDMELLADAVCHGGGIDQAWKVARRYYQKARQHLAEVGNRTKRNRLEEILDSIQDRKH
jgi:heptaprenyl diphosphate synthase